MEEEQNEFLKRLERNVKTIKEIINRKEEKNNDKTKENEERNGSERE